MINFLEPIKMLLLLGLLLLITKRGRILPLFQRLRLTLRHGTPPIVPISVNYHFTRRCNYACGFCFHTSLSSYLAPQPDSFQGLRRLADAGMRKINFAGGEPFLYHKQLGQMVRYCKRDLALESVSIVSNGSLIAEGWLREFGGFVDILALSCDSFVEETNVKIGRGKGQHVDKIRQVAQWCRKYGIMFKLNSVINSHNYREDMNAAITSIGPFRWKCFQVLVVEGENSASDGSTLRDAASFLVTAAQFDEFVQRHRHNACFVAEPNHLMKTSYLILDERLRFLNKVSNQPTRSILDVGVQTALRDAGWDQDCFRERGGVYEWTRERAGAEGAGEGCAPPTQEAAAAELKKLDW